MPRHSAGWKDTKRTNAAQTHENHAILCLCSNARYCCWTNSQGLQHCETDGTTRGKGVRETMMSEPMGQVVEYQVVSYWCTVLQHPCCVVLWKNIKLAYYRWKHTRVKNYNWSNYSWHHNEWCYRSWTTYLLRLEPDRDHECWNKLWPRIAMIYCE